jgi:tol-pal system protein YbgF
LEQEIRLARPRRLPAVLVTGLLYCAAGVAAGAAQPVPSTPDLEQRIAVDQALAGRLATRVADMSAQASGAERVAQLFGESDEEKAARLQREQAQDSSIAILNQRVGDLEDTLRRLTGQIEELDHRLSGLGERMARMRKDFDYKLCALAAQQLGASADSGDENSLPCNGAGQTGTNAPAANGSAPPAPGPGESIHLAPPPGVLGTLPRSDLANLPQPSAAPPNQMASLDARPQFEAALNLLAKAQYDEARAAFRSVADAYPQDSLAPQAIYWVGDIAYVQKDYAGAARAFAEELKKYPESPRAPESMLKLGQSLIAMDQKKEGCRALGTLPNEFPSASKSVTDEAFAARKEAGCR